MRHEAIHVDTSLARSLAAALALAVLGVLVFTVVQTEPSLATLGNEVIRESDFQRYLERTYPKERIEEIHRVPSERPLVIEEYLDNVAVVAKARRQGMDREEAFKRALTLMGRPNSGVC